ncbi:MAG: hypothetical protein WCG52_10630 [bacterium]
MENNLKWERDSFERSLESNPWFNKRGAAIGTVMSSQAAAEQAEENASGRSFIAL